MAKVIHIEYSPLFDHTDGVASKIHDYIKAYLNKYYTCDLSINARSENQLFQDSKKQSPDLFLVNTIYPNSQERSWKGMVYSSAQSDDLEKFKSRLLESFPNLKTQIKFDPRLYAYVSTELRPILNVFTVDQEWNGSDSKRLAISLSKAIAEILELPKKSELKKGVKSQENVPFFISTLKEISVKKGSDPSYAIMQYLPIGEYKIIAVKGNFGLLESKLGWIDLKATCVVEKTGGD